MLALTVTIWELVVSKEEIKFGERHDEHAAQTDDRLDSMLFSQIAWQIHSVESLVAMLNLPVQRLSRRYGSTGMRDTLGGAVSQPHSR